MASDSLLETTVQPDWVDYNGHMRDAFYGVVCSSAIDSLMDRIGLDAAHRAAHKGTLFTVEAHQYFLAEAHEGDPLAAVAWIAETDEKRMLLVIELRNGSTGTRLTVQEFLLLHVVQDGGNRVAPFPADIRAGIEAWRDVQDDAALPSERARDIRLKRR